MRVTSSAVLLIGLSYASLVLAQSMTGNALRGQQLASEVCANCHVVERDEYGLSLVGAPAFQELAENPEITELSLRVLLQTPHRDMPDLILDAEETDDIIAYIMSLR